MNDTVYLYFYNAKAKEFTELRGLFYISPTNCAWFDDEHGHRFACAREPGAYYNNTVWFPTSDKAKAYHIFMQYEAREIERYKNKLSYHAWLHTKFRQERADILKKEAENGKKICTKQKPDSNVAGRKAVKTKPAKHNAVGREPDTGHSGLLPAT